MSVTWAFGLRIDTAGELTGTVTAVALTGDVAGNNTAKIVVNPDGGSLPITGAPFSSVAATGAGLLVAGVIALFIGRRRRTS
jgi:LPXTG-motif cell wall-anchored protein